MSNTQPKRPKAGHAAKPPPQRNRKTVESAYALSFYGARKTKTFWNENHKQSPLKQAE